MNIYWIDVVIRKTSNSNNVFICYVNENIPFDGILASSKELHLVQF